jgi:hypothetical protein
MKECILQRRFGGHWFKRMFCVHEWKTIEKFFVGNLDITKSECIDCGRNEILMLVEWQLGWND